VLSRYYASHSVNIVAMLKRSFQEMGIPPGYGVKQLLYSPAASVLVAQIQSGVKNWRPERLFWRHIQSDKYNSIGQPDDLISQDSPFVHPSKPLLAYACMEHRFLLDTKGEEVHGADWDSLKIYNLETATEVESVNKETLTLPPGMVTGWIFNLVSFGDSGLFVQAGLSGNGSRIDYVIAELDLFSRILKPVVTLPATFI